MQTSPKGIAFMEGHEGVVLKAYRCPAGVWTIGSGLTSNSGVVKVVAGMTITRAQASQLLATALRRNYEPRVVKAMARAKQHEFDGGVSFDFNTGAIHRASWVKAWAAKNWSGVQSGLNAWVKGGGRVLPGLQRRRREEFDIIRYDRWPTDLKVAAATAQAAHDPYARFVVSVTSAEIAAIRDGFALVGFDPGDKAGHVSRIAVEAFQRRYDLTVDGLIGRATLSTLQREIDARTRAKPAAGGVAAGGAVAGGNEAAAPAPDAAGDALFGDALVTWAGLVMLAAAAGYGLYLAWHYRDMIAARVQARVPRLAAWLRSF